MGLAVRVQQADRIFCIDCFEYVVAERAESFDDIATHIVIVLHHKDTFSERPRTQRGSGYFRRLQPCQKTAAGRS